ncbi:MAG: SH3 domain-containing protein [bacterium]|nr:SH3 domain-containing protein [bacterium]
MARSRMVSLAVVFLALLTAPPMGGAAELYVAVVPEVVNIRAEPSTTSPVVAKAVRGDIFKVVSEDGGWYKIALFSGEFRYVYKPITRATVFEAELPTEKERISAIYQEVLRAEDRALNEAAAACSGDLQECVWLEQLLNDKYMLQIFHRFGLQPPLYPSLIVEAAKHH